MAVNETVVAFVRGGTAPDAAGGIGLVTSWATEVEFTLPGGRRKVRPDAVLQAPEIGVPVLMVEVDRSTMALTLVAAKFAAYRELFRVKVRDNDPARSGEEPADRTVHWWRRAYPGHTRAGYPPVALLVADAGPTALTNRQEAIGDLSVEAWGGWWCKVVRDYNEDAWREYDDSVPVIATTWSCWPGTGRWGRCGGATAAPDGTPSPRRWTTRTTAPPTIDARPPARTSSTRPTRS
ncbi:hypothetical protein P3T35_007331 [Kitasatospora sp. GP30]|jgi:hypothetical protein|uniref:replication-relaxation family protein n=1 Tax=Kitasatospora sp. GP30 TaxID=3035084 RepID=UPI000CCAD3DF|nr:replication-relaxation family protein [Kitasatospora sp. GP30]MDH6145276.1 hypothetical protein [Kitasatospora sp. GP30]